MFRTWRVTSPSTSSGCPMMQRPMRAALPGYLEPYSEAHRRRERGARALLWVGRHDQTVRFEALARLCPLAGLRLLDVGCGPGDLLPFLLKHGIRPAQYTGIEAQRWLVQ